MDDRQNLKEKALHAIDRAIKANQAYQNVLSKVLKTLSGHENFLKEYQQDVQSQGSSENFAQSKLTNEEDDYFNSQPSSPLSSMPITTAADGLTLSTPNLPSDSTSAPPSFFSFFTDGIAPIHISASSTSGHRPQLLTQSCEWTSQDRLILRRAIRNFFSFYLIKKGTLTLHDKITPSIDTFWPSIPESEIDWEHISLAYFGNNKTAMDCKVQWFSWDHPAYAKEPMSSEEVEQIIQLRSLPDFQNWLELAKSLSVVRSPIMAFHQYIMRLRSKGALTEKTGRKWTQEENELLLLATEIFGRNSWVHVASVVGTRDSKQCLHHWKAINPAIRSGPFTQVEDAILKEAYEKYGKQWNKVAKCLPGRTDSQCRERFTNLQVKSTRKGPWTEEENQCILAFVTLHGMKWSQLVEWLPGRSDREVSKQYRKLRRSIEIGERESPSGAQLPVDVKSINNWVKKHYPVDLTRSFDEITSGAIPPNSASLIALQKLLRVVDAPLHELQETNQKEILELDTFSDFIDVDCFSDAPLSKDLTDSLPSMSPAFLDTVAKHFLLPMATGTIQVHPVGWKGVEHAVQLREELERLVHDLHSPSEPNS